MTAGTTKATEMGNSLEVRLLGRFEVFRDRGPMDVKGPKRGQLVALLALRAGEVVTAEDLVEALWAESQPANARNARQHHVSRLRRQLGPESEVSTAGGYPLRGAAVDALLFEERLAEARAARRVADTVAACHAADDALSVWRGPALLGFLDAPWASVEARRLGASRADALEDRSDAGLELGDHVNLVPARLIAAVLGY